MYYFWYKTGDTTVKSKNNMNMIIRPFWTWHPWSWKQVGFHFAPTLNFLLLIFWSCHMEVLENWRKKWKGLENRILNFRYNTSHDHIDVAWSISVMSFYFNMITKGMIYINKIITENSVFISITCIVIHVCCVCVWSPNILIGGLVS